MNQSSQRGSSAFRAADVGSANPLAHSRGRVWMKLSALPLVLGV
jgi:hypothetical protein